MSRKVDRAVPCSMLDVAAKPHLFGTPSPPARRGEADPPARSTFNLRNPRLELMAMTTQNERNTTELMRDVDRTLLRENLKLTPAERLEKFAKFMRFASGLRDAGAATRRIEAETTRKQ